MFRITWFIGTSVHDVRLPGKPEAAARNSAPKRAEAKHVADPNPAGLRAISTYCMDCNRDWMVL